MKNHKQKKDSFEVVLGLFLISLGTSIILFDFSVLLNLVSVPLSIFGTYIVLK